MKEGSPISIDTIETKSFWKSKDWSSIYERKAVERVDTFEKEEIPLPFIPLPDEREPIDFDLKNTAGHEFNHACTAMAYGIDVANIDVRRKGDVLGVTTFIGDVSPETFSIIAGAGAYPTHDGTAKGFGSDLSQVRWLGKLSESDAIHRAGSAILRIPREVRERVAELIAVVKEISGSMIAELIKRAEYELRSEGKTVTKTDEEAYPKFENSYDSDNYKQKEYTTIEYLVGDTQRITHYINGEKIKESLICSKCGSINGHTQDCPKLQENQRINLKDYIDQKNPSQPIERDTFGTKEDFLNSVPIKLIEEEEVVIFPKS